MSKIVIVFAFLIIILLAFFWYFGANKVEKISVNEQNTSVTKEVKDREFINKKYKFKLQVPQGFEVNSLQEDYWTISTNTGTKLIEIIPESLGEGEEVDLKKVLSDYASPDSGKNFCSADGEGVSSTCDKLISFEELVNKAGIKGFKFTLNEKVTNYNNNKITNVIFGPNYLLDITNSSNLQVLRLSPVLSIKPEIVDEQLIQSVVDSINIKYDVF